MVPPYTKAMGTARPNLCTGPQADWFMMADHDVWFHPLALWNASLDIFLDAVPEDKVFVHSNYHSMNTGAIFVRQGIAAHRLIMQWWSIANSGAIECHGWDQAAAQLLLLYLLDGQDQERPFNFSCVVPRCGHPTKSTYWSCDFAFTAGLEAAFGLREAQLYERGKSQTGQSVPAFHVLTESPRFPRLQCMYCESLHTVSLRGKNYKTDPGCVNGWFTIHKGFDLFKKLFLGKQDGAADGGDVALAIPELQLGVMQGSFR